MVIVGQRGEALPSHFELCQVVFGSGESCEQLTVPTRLLHRTQDACFDFLALNRYKVRADAPIPTQLPRETRLQCIVKPRRRRGRDPDDRLPAVRVASAAS